MVCFLHSYANPAHERAAARLAAETLPGWFVSTSAEVLPEIREYERFSTAVLNAYIGPKVGGYLTRLAAALAARGYPGELFITTSSGGIMTAPRAARFPVHTVLSGPAGGVAAGLALGRLTGFRNLITYDMGGTSTDVCLIGDLEATLTTEQHIAGLPNRTPQIEINSIGAGGGSLAWIDAGGALRVGPRSAGADPGPACYGRGGADATITDANLVLGRVPADRPLAGEVPLDLDLARRAVSRLVPRVPGVAGEAELADGIVRIAVARMVSAIKEISIGKGHDPRDFVLLAYGGAGPMHAAFVADELEIPRVLVPTAPGNFSAFGSLISDLRHDHVRTRLVSTRQRRLRGGGGDLRRAGGGGAGDARAGRDRRRRGPARRAGSACATSASRGSCWSAGRTAPASMDALEAAFHQAHERRYGHASGGAIEIVNFRLTGVGVIAKPALPRWPAGGRVEEARRGERAVYFDGGFGAVPVYVRDRLPPGGRFAGPAIVEEMGSTTVVPPRWAGEVGEHGEIVLSRSSL